MPDKLLPVGPVPAPDGSRLLSQLPFGLMGLFLPFFLLPCSSSVFSVALWLAFFLWFSNLTILGEHLLGSGIDAWRAGMDALGGRKTGRGWRRHDLEAARLVGAQGLQRQEIPAGTEIVRRRIDLFGQRIRQGPAAVDVLNIDFLTGLYRRVRFRKQHFLDDDFLAFIPADLSHDIERGNQKPWPWYRERPALKCAQK